MHKNDYTDATPAGEYTNGNPNTATPQSKMGAKWLNAVQREIVGVVQQSGQTLSDADDAQLLKAVPLHVATIAALRALTAPTVNAVVQVRGYYADNDGGGGLFYWDSASSLADDAGMTVRPASNPATGRWRRVFSGRVSARWFGAKTDGTDASTAITAAIAYAGTLGLDLIGPGSFTISTGKTFTGRVHFVNSGSITTTSGQTYTFNRGWRVKNPEDRVILGSGTISLNRSYAGTGRPEMFGAVINAGDSTSASANDAALAQVVSVFKEVKIRRADYWTNSRWIIPEGATVIGTKGIHGTGGDTCMTRILIRSKTETAVQLGPTADPGSINAYAKNIRFEDFELTRDTSVGQFQLTPPAPGSEMSGAAGLELRHCLYTHIKNVWSRENQIGFLFNGSCNIRMDDCFAERSTGKDPAAPNADYWFGAAFNGSSDLASISTGGNISIMLNRCNFSLGGVVAAVSGGSPITSIAVNVNGPSSDLWLDTVESIQCQRGLEIGGVSDTSSHRLNSFIDISIENCKFDQVSSRAVYLHDLPTGSNVSISNTYTALGGGSPISCFEVRDSGGEVTIDQTCQAVCNSAVNAIGVYLHNASGVRADCMIENSQRPVVTESSSADCEIRAIVNTTEDATIAPIQGVAESTACARMVFALKVKSSVTTGSKKHASGVNLIGTGNSGCTVDTTEIDPAAISGGAANLVLYNGALATSLGAAGSNVVVGYQALLPATTIVGNASGSAAVPAALTALQTNTLVNAFAVGTATAYQTVGAHTFTTPSDSSTSTKYRAKLLGAGGGSGGTDTSGSAASGGGGAGEYCEVVFWGVAASTGITATCGTKGSGGAAGADGTDGTASTIALPNGSITAAGTFAGGTTIGAAGGVHSAGKTSVTSAPGGAGGSGGAGTADWRAAGKTGECGYPATKGGRGADSIWGGGGNATGNNQGNANAGGNGAGGGGAAGVTNTGKTGSDGMILIERLTP